MNTASAWIAALTFSVFATAPALADEVRFVNNEIGYEIVVSPSKVTRAQVIAELEQAQRDGEIVANHEIVQPLALTPSAKSHEQVQREASRISERERSAQRALYWPNA